MSLPTVNEPIWQRLASGGLARVKSQNLGIQMLTKRMERSPDDLNQKAREIHAFFTKWQGGLKDEIAQIARI